MRTTTLPPSDNPVQILLRQSVAKVGFPNFLEGWLVVVGVGIEWRNTQAEAVLVVLVADLPEFAYTVIGPQTGVFDLYSVARYHEIGLAVRGAGDFHILRSTPVAYQFLAYGSHLPGSAGYPHSLIDRSVSACLPVLLTYRSAPRNVQNRTTPRIECEQHTQRARFRDSEFFHIRVTRRPTRHRLPDVCKAGPTQS